MLPENRTQPYLWAQIQRWVAGLPGTEAALIGTHRNLISAILQKTRQGELAQAEELRDIDTHIISTSQLSLDAHYVCKSQLEAAAAYLDYKQQRFDQALLRLSDALHASSDFEERNPDFALVPHLHRITIMSNWVHVLVQRQMYHEALALGFQTLDYLERKVPMISVPASWDSSKLVAYPAEILSLFFQEAMMGILSPLTGTDMLDGYDGLVDLRDLFANYAVHHLHLDSCHLSEPAHAWLHMKQAHLAGDGPRFLDLAAKLLSAGPTQWSTLWYATIVELIVFSRRYRDARNALFQHEIMEEALAWKRLPPNWRAMLEESDNPGGEG